MKIFAIIWLFFSIYILFAQISAYFGYLFCKGEKSTKECRNGVCAKCKECSRNTVYEEL